MSNYNILSPGGATVGVASGQVLAANENRMGLVICNLSTNTIFFGLGYPAELDKGIVLYEHGVFSFDGFLFVRQSINAIATGAGSLISYQEIENAS